MLELKFSMEEDFFSNIDVYMCNICGCFLVINASGTATGYGGLCRDCFEGLGSMWTLSIFSSEYWK